MLAQPGKRAPHEGIVVRCATPREVGQVLDVAGPRVMGGGMGMGMGMEWREYKGVGLLV